MAQSGGEWRKSRGLKKKVRRSEASPATTRIDMRSLRRDAFHLVDLGGIPHAIRWTSDDVLEFYEVVEG